MTNYVGRTVVAPDKEEQSGPGSLAMAVLCLIVFLFVVCAAAVALLLLNCAVSSTLSPPPTSSSSSSSSSSSADYYPMNGERPCYVPRDNSKKRSEHYKYLERVYKEWLIKAEMTEQAERAATKFGSSGNGGMMMRDGGRMETMEEAALRRFS